MAKSRAASADFAATVSVRIAEKTRQLTQHLFDPYRPELHYMRGPGPKWREKHGPPPAQTHIGQLELSSLWNPRA